MTRAFQPGAVGEELTEHEAVEKKGDFFIKIHSGQLRDETRRHLVDSS
jgi:hypothetical protein